MEDIKIESVKNWLEAIIPSVVETLVANLTLESLRDMGKEEGIHGPIVINLEEFRAPITAINFYVMVVGDGMMLATTADVKGSEKNASEIGFDMFFPIVDFAEIITDEEHIHKLVNIIIEQYKKVV